MNVGERKWESGGKAVYMFGAEEINFFRPSGALSSSGLRTHGLRRGLRSCAAPRLWFSNSVQHFANPSWLVVLELLSEPVLARACMGSPRQARGRLFSLH